MRRFTPSMAADGAEQTPEQNDLRRRRGVTAMEYLFVLSLILTVAITGIGYFGQSTKNTTQKASNAIQNATNGK